MTKQITHKNTSIPFLQNQINSVLKQFGSPIYIYDEAGIRSTSKEMKHAFSWTKNYKNFFAVKATPTPAILKILHEEGMGFDCSTRTELLMVEKLGIPGEDIFFTSNNTPKEDFELAIKLGATVNIDDLSQVPVYIDALNGNSVARLAARYNPGDLKSGNIIIGEPTEAKYGMSLDDLVDAFTTLKAQNISEFGLHTMVASNELDVGYFEDTTKLLVTAVNEIEKKAGIKISFVNLGGGFGVNYRPDQKPFDINEASERIKKVFQESGKDLELCTENGRYVTGPHGYLVTTVRYVMNKYKTYVGVDASMHNLMRPGMYNAYHHITVLGKQNDESMNYDVVGSLCENNDKFAIDRKLPQLETDDILVIHDAGAHGHSMGFNYNGLLRSAEVLVKTDGKTELIRRAETVNDYFAPLIWD